MELDFDIPAWFAYALVLVVSLFIAMQQVGRLLEPIPWPWTRPETYLLFVLFWALPLLIFWSLDRMGAIHDSSLLSALIVATGYVAIIRGKSQIASKAVAALFSPLLDWMDRIPDRIIEHMQPEIDAFTTPVAARVGGDNSEVLLERLRDWVFQNTEDTVTLMTRVHEFMNAHPEPPRGPALARAQWRKEFAERLLMFVTPTLRVRVVFVAKGLLPWTLVAAALIPRYPDLLRWVVPTILILLFGWIVVDWMRTSPAEARRTMRSAAEYVEFGNFLPRYQGWRYLKPNNTSTDVKRALDYIAVRLDEEIRPSPPDSQDPLSPVTSSNGVKPPTLLPTAEIEHAPVAIPRTQTERLSSRGQSGIYSALVTKILSQPEITKAHAEDLLRVVLRDRFNPHHLDTTCAALSLLPPALRSPNVEIRALINTTLTEASTQLWKTTPSDIHADAQSDMVAIESTVVTWSDFLGAHCSPLIPSPQILPSPAPALPVPPPSAPAAPESVPAPASTSTPSAPELPDIDFDLNSPKLRATAHPILDPVARFLESHPTVMAHILGYTDNTGPAEYDQTLSERRAEAVRRYLMSKGIESSRLTAQGFGQKDPVASNDTRKGRAKNRRVAIRIDQHLASSA